MTEPKIVQRDIGNLSHLQAALVAMEVTRAERSGKRHEFNEYVAQSLGMGLEYLALISATLLHIASKLPASSSPAENPTREDQ